MCTHCNAHASVSLTTKTQACVGACAGAVFISPCGPCLTTLSSTVCVNCLIQGCRSSCEDPGLLNCTTAYPSAVAAITDAGTGNLLLQGLTIEGCDDPVAHVVPQKCALPGNSSFSSAPGPLHLCADSLPGATAEFNQSIIDTADCTSQSRFLPAVNPVYLDLEQHVRPRILFQDNCMACTV